MKEGELKEVTGEWVKSCYDWLKEKDCGCCSLWYESTEEWRYCVCIGWHDYDNGGMYDDHGCQIAWKIGRQSHNNVMQCDLDVDFEMPFPCNEYGDVWDSEQMIEPPAKPTKKYWNDLATEIRKEAREVWKFFKDKDGWEQEDFKRSKRKHK